MQVSEEMYTVLFNAITDAITMLDEGNTKKAQSILKNAQVNAEELFINK